MSGQSPKNGASRPPKTVRFAWHHLRGEVPADWEVARFSVEDRDGRLEFANRDGLQATASWEPCDREPDRLTTMTAFLANNLLGRKEAQRRGLRSSDVRTADVGPFLVGWLDEKLPVQALAYDRAGGRLIRWIFEGRTTPEGRRTVVEPVLRSFDDTPDPETCEYDLFGIRAVLPRDYRIEDLVVLPANVMMSFEGETSRSRVVLRRWGLAGHLLGDGDLGDFYAGVVRTHKYEILSCERCEINGGDGRRVRFAAPRQFHGDRFMARRWKNGLAYVWHDRAANRIGVFEQIGPKTHVELPPETVPGLTVTHALDPL